MFSYKLNLTSLFDQHSSVTRTELFNSQIEIASRKLDTSHCRYGDRAQSVSRIALASCPSRWVNSVTHAHTVSLSSLTPPLCLISSPLFSLHLHTSHLPLTGDFQCIFNDDLAGKWIINCRMAILQSSTVKLFGGGGNTYIYLSFGVLFSPLHVSK